MASYLDLRAKGAAFMGQGNERSIERWELWLVLLLGAYFVGRLIYFAFTVGPGLPPDETTHIGIARLYAQTLLGIEDSPASYQYGLVTHAPYLYYFMLGKIAAIFGEQGYRFLRMVNVVLAAVQIIVAYRLGMLLIRNALGRILFFVMLTNTLMFGFLSASVNYDNLANLLAVLSVFFLVRYQQELGSRLLLAFLLCTGLGMLTKATFLMLGPVLWLAWLFMRGRDLPQDLRRLMAELRARQKSLWLMVAAVVLCIGANVALYGVNLVRYGTVAPGCSQVIAHEHCMENRIYARNWVVTQYTQGKMSFMEAWQATALIKHPGDRDHAKRLLNNERGHKSAAPENLNVLDYMHLVWVQAVKPSIFGIQAHRSMLRTPNDLWPYGLIFFAALLLWVRKLQFDGADRLWHGFAIMVFGYYLFLVGYYNYTSYLQHHALLLGVQGRYLFHVLVPFYLLMAEFLLRPFQRPIQWAVLLLVAAVFIAGDFPYYLEHVTPEWGQVTG